MLLERGRFFPLCVHDEATFGSRRPLRGCLEESFAPRQAGRCQNSVRVGKWACSSRRRPGSERLNVGETYSCRVVGRHKMPVRRLASGGEKGCEAGMAGLRRLIEEAAAGRAWKHASATYLHLPERVCCYLLPAHGSGSAGYGGFTQLPMAGEWGSHWRGGLHSLCDPLCSNAHRSPCPSGIRKGVDPSGFPLVDGLPGHPAGCLHGYGGLQEAQAEVGCCQRGAGYRLCSHGSSGPQLWEGLRAGCG